MKYSPQITRLRCLDTHPPVWFVDADGKSLVLTNKELHRYVLFHRAAMENGLVYDPMAQAEWTKALRVIKRNLTVIPLGVPRPTITKRNDPVLWVMDVDGVRLALTTQQLQSNRLFCRAAMEKGLHYKPMGQAAWFAHLRTAMQDMTIIPHYAVPNIPQ